MSYRSNRRRNSISRYEGLYLRREAEEDESTLPSLASTATAGSDNSSSTMLACPAGMEESTFMALPVELQRELIAQHESERHLLSQESERELGRGEQGREARDDEYYRGKAREYGICPTFLLELPNEMRDDILREHQQNSSTDVVSTQMSTAAAYGFDPAVLNALPPEIKAEVLAQQQQQQARRPSSPANTSTPSTPPRPSSSSSSSQPRPALPQHVSNSHFSARSQHSSSTLIEAEYSGTYDDAGQRSGQGTLTYENGGVYKGDFARDLRHGKGEMIFADASNYKGGWVQDHFHGYGVRRFANGDMFIGNYANGQRNGHGKFEYAKGDTYVGEWVNGKMDGYGTYYHKNGDAYEGMFDNGRKHGPGKYSLSDGRLDICKYVNGQRNGLGVRLSAERKRAWRLKDGNVEEEISLEEAYEVQESVGFER